LDFNKVEELAEVIEDELVDEELTQAIEEAQV